MKNQIPDEIVKQVCKRTQVLLKETKEFVGANAIVAKAIETYRDCQIKCVPRSTTPGVTESYVLTDVTKVVFKRGTKDESQDELVDSGKECISLRHTIYYVSAATESESREIRERWLIAHELGHLWLHWSKNNKPNSHSFWMRKPDEKNGWGYAVCFKEKQEQEADAFATLLLAHWSPDSCLRNVQVDEQFEQMLHTVSEFLQSPHWDQNSFNACQNR